MYVNIYIYIYIYILGRPSPDVKHHPQKIEQKCKNQEKVKK